MDAGPLVSSSTPMRNGPSSALAVAAPTPSNEVVARLKPPPTTARRDNREADAVSAAGNSGAFTRSAIPAYDPPARGLVRRHDEQGADRDPDHHVQYGVGDPH